jgi:hypothetical protein
MLTSSVASIARMAALDRSVVFSVLGTLAAALLGTINTLLVASTFSQVTQGFFYTFGSLITLCILVEFGLGQTVIQFASHERARVNGETEGHAPRLESSRLAGFGQICLLWYLLCGLVVLGLLGPVGSVLLARREADMSAWLGPWALLCLGAAGNVLLTPFFILVQVFKDASVYWFYRLVYQIVYGLTLGCAIYLGAGLWAPGVATSIALLWSVAYAGRHTVLLRRPWASIRPTVSLWFHELWPVQWRIATSGLSAHFTIPLLVVVAFHRSGPVLAGQIGMSGAANALLLAVASSWVVTRAPAFAALAALGHAEELQRIFFRAWRAMLAVAATGAVTLWTAVWLLNRLQHPMAERLIGSVPMGLFVTATVLQSAVAGVVVYTRAHKREPLGLVNLAAVAVAVLSSAILAPVYGATGVAICHLAAVALVQVPAAAWCQSRLPRGRERAATVSLRVAE